MVMSTVRAVLSTAKIWPLSCSISARTLRYSASTASFGTNHASILEWYRLGVTELNSTTPEQSMLKGGEPASLGSQYHRTIMCNQAKARDFGYIGCSTGERSPIVGALFRSCADAFPLSRASSN